MKKYFICLSLLALLAGCQPTEKPKIKEKTNTSEVSVSQEATASYISPLTGVEVDQELMNRPVAVMINNHPKARPQAGLPQADIVYEALAEGDITRFLAIFHSEKPAFIGPVRSARDYYIDLSNGYHALYICHGWSPEAKQMLESGDVDHLNGLFFDGILFERVSFRKAPHDSYISYDNILKGAGLKGYEMEEEVEPLLFQEKPFESEGKKAQKITISYSRGSMSEVEYVYNKKDGRYDRFTSNEKLIDYNTKQPVQMDNILIVEMDHEIVDQQGRRDIDLTSGGKGYLIQKGKALPVQWKNENGRIVPYREGNPIHFIKGKTWINIVPLSPGLEHIVSIQSNEKGV
ncbi:DUF3048 domain-containing protein [Bacillus songklensis]|uniref:DUF3048 domain-containing protein n=1 Tax=Bacillus songklensis TaxID=1069116 RepID=A0ABV8B8B1_9BACI